MPISKKLPSDLLNQEKQEKQEKIYAFIKQGGSVPIKNEEKRIKNLQLRLTEDLIRKIDEKCKTEAFQMKKCSRHSWILDAIIKKLENYNE